MMRPRTKDDSNFLENFRESGLIDRNEHARWSLAASSAAVKGWQFMSNSNLRLSQQQELYELLQNFSTAADEGIEEQLKKALSIIKKMSGANQAYLEVRDRSGRKLLQSQSMSQSEVDSVKEQISKGIIAQALREGEPISTSTAFLDPRFDSMESVRLASIESVFCAPFGGDHADGVIYLQGDSDFDAEAGRVKLDAQTFIDHIEPFLDQLIIEFEQASVVDPTYLLRRRFRLQGIFGSSQSLARALQAATTVAPLEVNVLITGESGTGKTQVAHAIHVNSKRSSYPFMELNCGAIQDTLVESELFGTVKGAFNDAVDKPGKVRAAENGTLFLDEVSELSASAQTKLLQFLQSGEYFSVGSEKKMKSDVRVLCASNKKLEELVSKGRFRQDLFFRINPFVIRMPALKERDSDVIELAEQFCQLKCIKHGFGQLQLSDELLIHLKARPWPGNIRELDNYIESACIHAVMEESMVVELRHAVAGTDESESDLNRFSIDNKYAIDNFHSATKLFQREFLKMKLKEYDGNILQTSRKLGLLKSHIYNLISEFDLNS